MKKRIVTLLTLLGINEHLTAQQKSDLVDASYQIVPGTTAATGFKLMGVPASEILVLVSILFVVLQAAQLIWKWRRDYRADKRREMLNACPMDESDAP